jgi:hypothetical protein
MKTCGGNFPTLPTLLSLSLFLLAQSRTILKFVANLYYYYQTKQENGLGEV